jgi:hypothetical protein
MELFDAFGRPGGRWSGEARNGALVGLPLRVELHQKREKAVRHVPWRCIKGSKLLTDRRLKGAETQGFIQSVVFTALCEVKPFLSHLDQRRAYSSIRRLLGRRKAFGSHAPSFPRPITR